MFKLTLEKASNESLCMRTRSRKKRGLYVWDTQTQLAVQGKKQTYFKVLQTKTQDHIFIQLRQPKENVQLKWHFSRAAMAMSKH
jgi:predicted RNA-binding protein YlxR (DUF448 family)